MQPEFVLSGSRVVWLPGALRVRRVHPVMPMNAACPGSPKICDHARNAKKPGQHPAPVNTLYPGPVTAGMRRFLSLKAQTGMTKPLQYWYTATGDAQTGAMRMIKMLPQKWPCWRFVNYRERRASHEACNAHTGSTVALAYVLGTNSVGNVCLGGRAW